LKIPPHFYALSASITIMRKTGVSLRRKQREVVLREAPRYPSNVIEYEGVPANVHAEQHVTWNLPPLKEQSRS